MAAVERMSVEGVACLVAALPPILHLAELPPMQLQDALDGWLHSGRTLLLQVCSGILRVPVRGKMALQIAGCVLVAVAPVRHGKGRRAALAPKCPAPCIVKLPPLALSSLFAPTQLIAGCAEAAPPAAARLRGLEAAAVRHVAAHGQRATPRGAAHHCHHLGAGAGGLLA